MPHFIPAATALPETIRCVIYARQSVQEDEGIRRQITNSRFEVERREWTLVGEPLQDNAVSATKQRAYGTGWRVMLAMYDRGEFEVLVVSRIDRLIRNIDRDMIELSSREMKILAGGTLYDLADPDATSVFRVLAVMSQREVEVKAVRSNVAHAARKLDGHPKAGRVPYGYALRKKPLRDETKDPTRYSIIPQEAAVLRWAAMDLLANEGNLAATCKKLNLKGRRTHSSAHHPSGVAWRTSSLKRALVSPFITALLPPSQPEGEFRPEKVVVGDCTEGAWQAILDRDRWVALRGLLLDEDRRTNFAGPEVLHLLVGLAQCSVCTYNVRSAKSRHGRPGYRCRNGHFLRAGDVIEQYIEELVVARLSASDARELLRKPVSGPDVGVLKGLCADLRAQMRQVVRLTGRDGFSGQEAEKRLDELDAEEHELRRQIDAAMAIDPLAAIIEGGEVEGAWRALDLHRKRAVIAALMTITVHPVGQGGRCRSTVEAASSIDIAWRVERWSPAEGDLDEFPLMLTMPDGSFVPHVSATRSDLMREALVGAF